MEHINGVSLLNYLKSKPNRKIDEEIVKNIFNQIISGIQYIHSKHISHGDIKLENLLIDSNNNIKIIDFGFGTHSFNGKLLNFFCGTPSYMPPEIINRKNYQGSCADIWSVGVLLYTLICGSFPFRGSNQ